MNLALDILVDGNCQATVVLALGQQVGLRIRPHAPEPRPRVADPAKAASPSPEEPCPCGSGKLLAECMPEHTRVDPTPPVSAPQPPYGPGRAAYEAWKKSQPQEKGGRVLGWFRGKAVRALETARNALAGKS